MTREESEIIKTYEAGGETAVSVGMKFDVPVWTVYRILQKNGVQRKNRNQVSKSRKKEIVEAYLSNMETTKGIAKRFGVSDTTVRNILRENGVVPSKNAKPISKEVEDRIVRLYESGSNIHDIANMCSIVPSTARKVLIRRGIKLRPSIKRKILSFGQRKQLAEDYKDGTRYEDLYVKYNVSNSVVRSCLKEFVIKPRTPSAGFYTAEWVDRRERRWTFKSNWELAYAKYLDEQLLEWDYEPCKFSLGAGRSGYTPDFRVCRDGQYEYHEVKGWLTPQCIGCMKQFKKQYPEKKLVFLGPVEMVNLGLVEKWHAKNKAAKIASDFRRDILGEGKAA